MSHSFNLGQLRCRRLCAETAMLGKPVNSAWGRMAWQIAVLCSVLYVQKTPSSHWLKALLFMCPRNWVGFLCRKCRYVSFGKESCRHLQSGSDVQEIFWNDHLWSFLWTHFADLCFPFFPSFPAGCVFVPISHLLRIDCWTAEETECGHDQSADARQSIVFHLPVFSPTHVFGSKTHAKSTYQSFNYDSFLFQ